MTNLKTHAPVDKNQPKEHGKQQNVLKPMRLCTKTKRKGARTKHGPPGYSHPGGPAIRITVCMRPRSFASPARTARTTRTKRKRRRNEADLPVTGGGQAGLTPLNLRYMATCKYLLSKLSMRLGPARRVRRPGAPVGLGPGVVVIAGSPAYSTVVHNSQMGCLRRGRNRRPPLCHGPLSNIHGYPWTSMETHGNV